MTEAKENILKVRELYVFNVQHGALYFAVT